MGKGMKSYLVFTTGVYRLVLFGVVPAAAAAIQILLLLFTDTALGTAMVLAAGFMMGAEVSLDYWVFGAIAMRGGSSLEYLKSSARGRLVVKTALRQDMIRILIECTAVLAVGMTAGMTVYGDDTVKITFLLALLLDEFFVTVSMKWFARHFDNFRVSTSIAGLGCLLFFPLIGLTFWNLYLMLAILAVLSASVSVLSVKMILRRVEESYYDR